MDEIHSMNQKQWEAIIKSREDMLIKDFSIEIEKRDKTLITELCDALEDYAGLRGHQGDLWLVQRAREATR